MAFRYCRHLHSYGMDDEVRLLPKNSLGNASRQPISARIAMKLLLYQPSLFHIYEATSILLGVISDGHDILLLLHLASIEICFVCVFGHRTLRGTTVANRTAPTH